MLINKYHYLSYIKNIYKKINFNKKNNNINNQFSQYMKKSLQKTNNIKNKKINFNNKINLNSSNNFVNKILFNLKKSKISIDVAIQIRNQILFSYHEIMNIQT
ncbi:Flagellar hook-basal body complex protein FliE [Buchnera aphidicola (Periphyllus testudinaceus)]|uniref:flagellar hook-basal body complex protein FliE n=1 Tax=Buchnera aphidicola TaxID=9 RepID=UPI0034639074